MISLDHSTLEDCKFYSIFSTHSGISGKHRLETPEKIMCIQNGVDFTVWRQIGGVIILVPHALIWKLIHYRQQGTPSKGSLTFRIVSDYDLLFCIYSELYINGITRMVTSSNGSIVNSI